MPILEVQKPLYKHDCEDCIYLGSDEMRDYYFAHKNSCSSDENLVIKLGDKPSDYFSMSKDVVKTALANNSLEEDTAFAMCYKKYLEHLKNK